MQEERVGLRSLPESPNFVSRSPLVTLWANSEGSEQRVRGVRNKKIQKKSREENPERKGHIVNLYGSSNVA